MLIPGRKKQFEQGLTKISQLKLLQNKQERLEVRLKKSRQSLYQSLVLDIDAEQQSFTIDSLYPALKEQLSALDILIIQRRKPGQVLKFEAEFLRFNQQKQLVLALPKQLESKQQRQNFRVYLNQDSGIGLYIQLERKLPCAISNLSSTGIAFTIPGDVSRQIKTGQSLKHCELMLPGNSSLYVDINIKSVNADPGAQLQTQVGGTLSIDDKNAEKQLNQFIWSQQRSQRQREVDGF